MELIDPPSRIRAASGRTQYTDDFFIYPVNIGTLAQNASATVNIQIQADSNFEWMMATCFSALTSLAAGTVNSDTSIMSVLVQMIDTGSGRQLFNSGVQINSFAGTGKQPFILPIPKVFMARSTIQVTATNNDNDANSYDNIQLNLIGRKIFELGGGR